MTRTCTRGALRPWDRYLLLKTPSTRPGTTCTRAFSSVTARRVMCVRRCSTRTTIATAAAEPAAECFSTRTWVLEEAAEPSPVGDEWTQRSGTTLCRATSPSVCGRRRQSRINTNGSPRSESRDRVPRKRTSGRPPSAPRAGRRRLRVSPSRKKVSEVA